MDWFRRNQRFFPDGHSTRSVPGLGFELTLQIIKENSACPEGRVCVMRSGVPDNLRSVVRKALEDKLDKLTGTTADQRILLFEKDNLPRGYTEIGRVVESFVADLPDLAMIDQIWVVNTVA